MKSASIKEIKQEIEVLTQVEVTGLLMRLAKFKKENKELLTYLLFESQDESGYISAIKESLHLQFTEVNIKSLYITKKNLRKIVRTANRFIKYSDDPLTEIEVLIYVCNEISGLGINLTKSAALQNIYTSLLNKIYKKIESLHEDLQYDYLKEFDKIK